MFLSTVNPTRCTNVSNYFIFEKHCWLVASEQTAVLFDKCLIAVCTVLNSWWWKERPPETRVFFFKKIRKIEILVHLIGFTIEIYYDARPYKRQSSTYIYLSHWTFLHFWNTVGILKLYRCEMLRSETGCYTVPLCVEVCKFFFFPAALSTAILR